MEKIETNEKYISPEEALDYDFRVNIEIKSGYGYFYGGRAWNDEEINNDITNHLKAIINSEKAFIIT